MTVRRGSESIARMTVKEALAFADEYVRRHSPRGRMSEPFTVLAAEVRRLSTTQEETPSTDKEQGVFKK